MCVIIHKPQNTQFPDKDIEIADLNNPHGFGYMYYNQKTKRVEVNKSIDYNADDIKKTFKKFDNKNIVFHFRYRTHGDIGNKQCHPFKVLSKEKHGEDLYFMHNGTIHGVDKTKLLKGESDTQGFNRLILHPLLSKDPGLIHVKPFQEMLTNYIGPNSKLCFMTGTGKVIKINEKAGATREGCWVSNLYSFNPDHRKPKTTTYSSYSSYNRSYTGTGAAKKTTTYASQIPPTTIDMFGVNIQRKSMLNICRDNEKEFFEEGEVTYVNAKEGAVSASFKVLGKTEYFYFDTMTGASRARGTYPAGYFFAYPADIKYEGTEKEVSSNVVMLEDKRKEAQKKEETEEKVDECIVSCKGLSVDAEDRWGGGSLSGVPSSDGELLYGDKTLLDVFNMSPQERFTFFVDKIDDSFNMFQDIIEFLIMDDAGLFPEDDEIEFEEGVE